MFICLLVVVKLQFFYVLEDRIEEARREDAAVRRRRSLDATGNGVPHWRQARYSTSPTAVESVRETSLTYKVFFERINLVLFIAAAGDKTPETFH